MQYNAEIQAKIEGKSARIPLLAGAVNRILTVKVRDTYRIVTAYFPKTIPY
jgi:hypothetical protein